MLNVLVIFNKRQMYTNSTYDFVDSFSKYSKNKIFYYDWDVVSEIKISLSKFDVIILHWSSRLIIEDVNNVSVNFLKDFIIISEKILFGSPQIINIGFLVIYLSINFNFVVIDL